MKNILLGMSFLAVLVSANSFASSKVSDENSLHHAIAMANTDSSINKIVFEKNVMISLSSPVIYTGSQDMTLLGDGATIDGANAGSFVLDADLTAITTEGTLVFNTAANIAIQRLNVVNSATRGIVVNIPGDAQGDDIQVSLQKVNVLNSALYGLHVDDNANEFDDGTEGSAIGIELKISHSNFIANGTGAIDFDGVRVDERGQGDIHVILSHTHINGNGGDGIELDEAGDGHVVALMRYVTLNDNGFYNSEDLDDGFDIDEAGNGDIDVSLYNVKVNNNMDEGLDFDEAGEGDAELNLRHVIAMGNADEGIKVDEEGSGNIEARISRVKVIDSGDDGLQFTELGDGRISVELSQVEARDNQKYGVKMEQWDVEGEELSVEEEGGLEMNRLTLSGNGKGDELKLNNIHIFE